MIYHNILKNNTIKLRALEPEDINTLYEWENDVDNWLVSATQKPYSKDVLLQYIENSVYDIYTTKQLRLMIDEIDSGETVGAIDLFEFDPNNRKAGIGILINEKYRKRGFAKQSLQLLVRYCFEVLNLHQVYANISVTNEASISLFESEGFSVVGIKKEWIRTPHGWLDELLLQKINNTNVL